VRITRLALRDVRRYRDLEVELAPGLTIVRGPNEAGKTTMQRAIELALTRKATSASADMEALRSWDAEDDARPEIELDFTDEDEDGVRTGSLLKSYRGPKGTARLVVDEEIVTDPARVDGGVLPVDGVDPPSRGRRPRSRRGQPAGPAPGLDQRCRPGDVTSQEAVGQGHPGPRRPG
jgi:hypothetical protein